MITFSFLKKYIYFQDSSHLDCPRKDAKNTNTPTAKTVNNKRTAKAEPTKTTQASRVDATKNARAARAEATQSPRTKRSADKLRKQQTRLEVCPNVTFKFEHSS